MFQYTDNFSLKNKEIFKYLTRARTLHPDQDSISTLHVLRRWSSSTPVIPRPSAFYNRGGGFFVTHKGKGIAVDPGFDFVLNLYQEGFSVNDVDAVIITHDHIDHYADFDTLLTLWHLNRKFSSDKPVKEIYLSAGFMARYNYLLTQDDKFNVYPLKAGSKVIPSGVGHAYELLVHKALHKDLSTNTYSIGLILDLKMDRGESFQIGFTGDTTYDENILVAYINCDIILFNLCSLPFREMKHCLKLQSNSDANPYQEKLKDIFSEFEKGHHKVDLQETANQSEFDQGHHKDDLKQIANQLYYAFWYPIGENDAIEYLFSINEDREYEDLGIGEHLYLKGLLAFNKLLQKRTQVSSAPRLVVITELKEDIGSFRTKIADEINRANGYPDNLKFLTGDIGLTVQMRPKTDSRVSPIQVGCSRCRLNNDYLDHDIFHPIHRINDFCIKGEEEGVFYLC
jgi:ribonuclease BN (tRNA processing enzyme)